MAETKKKLLKDREHPLYTKNSDKWEFFRDSTKGGEDFAKDIIGSQGFKHRLEDSTDLTQRQNRVYYLNYCDSLPNIYNSYIFRENIKRPPDKNLEFFRNNVDRRGTSISSFIKKAGRYASIYGACHILVDIPSTTKKNPSVADVKTDKISPFCSIIIPSQLKDWSIDEAGNFRWILYEYEYHHDLDPKIERTTETLYKVITKTEWWIEDEDGKPAKFDDGEPSNGTNSLGFIPIYTLYNIEGEDDKVGESMLKDIAYVNRIILSWCSLIDEQIERQTFSQLTMPDDQAMDEDENKGRDPLDRISTSSIFTFNPESKHPPAFISPNVETINTIWNLVLDHVKEIFRMAGLLGGTSDLYTSRSGRQSQMSFKSVDSSLAEKALTYQKCENEISRIAYTQLGVDNTNFESVKYPSSFDTAALAEEIDGFLKVMERNFSETLNKSMMKDIARKATPLAPESIREQIESEIESGDGRVETLQSNSILPEEKGQGNTNSNLDKSFKGTKDAKTEDSQHRTTDKIKDNKKK